MNGWIIEAVWGGLEVCGGIRAAMNPQKLHLIKKCLSGSEITEV